MAYGKKQIDHAAYQKNLKSKTIEQLKFIIKDASEAANLGGDNAGYYLDEVSYAAAELRRRYTKNTRFSN